MAIPIAVIGDMVGSGTLIAKPSVTVKIGGQPVCLAPATVSPHGSDAHASATVAAGKITKLKIDKQPVIGDGDVATCGHVVIAKNKKVTAS